MATKIVKQGGNALLINTNAGRLDVGALVELVRVGNFQTQQKVRVHGHPEVITIPEVFIFTYSHYHG